MPQGIRAVRPFSLLCSCWIAGFLVASAWRGDADDDSNTSEPEANLNKQRGYDVFSEARDSLLQAKGASLIQQGAIYDSLVATRNALLNAMKDKRTLPPEDAPTAGTQKSNSVPSGASAVGAAGNKNTTIPLPYSSFVTPAPSAVLRTAQPHAQEDSSGTTPGNSQANSPKKEERISLDASSQDEEPGQQKEQDKAADGPLNWVGKDFSGYFDEVKYTVIRIQAITSEINWFTPYQQPQDMQLVGSGLAVYTDEDCHRDPVFLTNAHVVRDAKDVQVQLPALGYLFFDAYVPLICEDFDLAIVQLKNPEEFLAALKVKPEDEFETKVHGKAQDTTAVVHGNIQSLIVEDWPLILGLEVASLGFPLGSTTLKLSRGVISGTEEVNDFICYQTTAPISPGSSGGPLFALNEKNKLQAIGVTFASAASYGAQNTNYVVPTVSIIQVVKEFLRLKTLGQTAPAAIDSKGSTVMVKDTQLQTNQSPPVDGNAAVEEERKPRRFPHNQFQIAPVNAMGIEANEALYKSVGCQSGVYISMILNTSVFKHAEPEAIPERCFLTKVGDIPLDNFGMGRTASFLGDPTPFESLMMEKAKDDKIVPVTVCQKTGDKTEIKEYKVDMTWKKEFYEMGVKDVIEPHFEKEAMRHEIFAGVTLMQMSVQHIIRLLKMGEPPTLGRWLLPENQKDAHLIVTHVEKGTYASRVLVPGMVVDKVNGKTVTNFASLEEAFYPPGGQSYWELVTDRKEVFATDFLQAVESQFFMFQAGLTYLMTDMFAKTLAKMQSMGPTMQPQLEGTEPVTQEPLNRKDPQKRPVQAPKGEADGGNEVSIQIQVPLSQTVQKQDFQLGSAADYMRVSYGANRTEQQNRVMAHADPTDRIMRLDKARALMMLGARVDTGNASSREAPDLEARRRARAARAGFMMAGVNYHGLSSLAETAP